MSPTGVLTYTPAANAFGSATITLVAVDNGGTANGGNDTSPPQSFQISVTAVNDPPILDLNGPAVGIDYAATYTEGNPATAIVDPAALSVSDVDNANLTSATVTITNLLDAASRIPGGEHCGHGDRCQLCERNRHPEPDRQRYVANYQAVLRTLTYLNSSTAPNETARSDQRRRQRRHRQQQHRHLDVTVVGVNAIPSFTGGPPVIINEDAGAQTIANWATAINDNDGGAQTLNFTVTPSGGS